MLKMAVVINLTGLIQASAYSAWTMLREQYGVSFISSRSQCPHIAMSAGTVDTSEALLDRLGTCVQNYRPFTIQGNGLGIYVRESPVIYIRWNMTETFFKFHQKLSEDLSATWLEPSRNTQPYYWEPKTSLAYSDSAYLGLGDVVQDLKSFNFETEMTVSQLLALELTGHGEVPIQDFAFHG